MQIQSMHFVKFNVLLTINHQTSSKSIRSQVSVRDVVISVRYYVEQVQPPMHTVFSQHMGRKEDADAIIDPRSHSRTSRIVADNTDVLSL